MANKGLFFALAGGLFLWVRGRRIQAKPYAEKLDQVNYVMANPTTELEALVNSIEKPLPDVRGFRNNNPGNIEYHASNPWRGQTGSDGRFAIFSDMRYGIRALGKLIDTYHDRYGLITIEGIINRWAPPHENETTSYIGSVASYTGVDSRSPINLERDKPAIVAAIIRHENGVQPFTDDYIREGINA